MLKLFLKNFKNRLIIFFLALTLFPISAFAYSSYIIPGGENIGIQIQSDGIIIVGLYKVGGISPGEDAGLKVGDKIVGINNYSVNKVSDLVNNLQNSNQSNKIKIKYKRNNRIYETILTLVKYSDSTYKTGLYVKDTINGIGTLTYIDPETELFGALGHEITEKNSMQVIEVQTGKIYRSVITGIEKSIRGNPGEKSARFFSNQTLGNIFENTYSGIFGKYVSTLPTSEALKVAAFDDIKLGSAKIRTVISGEKIEEFAIKILKLNNNKSTKHKNILFEITDKRLLDKTGGIIQGMSGSPIIQSNMIIGAVTHVVVDNAKKGYGIYIGYMLEESEN
jgi:stage IV sporulation protein B